MTAAAAATARIDPCKACFWRASLDDSFEIFLRSRMALIRAIIHAERARVRQVITRNRGL